MLSSRLLLTLFCFGTLALQSGVSQTRGLVEPEGESLFGSIPDSLWSLEPAPDAPYEVLRREISIRFFDRGDRVVSRIRRHERIIVWSDDPGDQLEASWISIPLPESEEVGRIVSLRGGTWNRGADPAMFGLEEMSEGEVNQMQRVREHRFPDVQEGSILDLEYELERTYLEELPPVQLADEVPVRYARVTLYNEPWLRYRSVWTGNNHPVHHLEEVRDTSSIPHIFTYQRPDPVSIERWVAHDLPASPELPYSIPAPDRLLTLHLQLAEWGVPRQPLINSWDYVEAVLRRGEGDPWDWLSRLDELRTQGAQFRTAGDEEERLEAVWSWLIERRIFNGDLRWIPEGDPGQVVAGKPSDQAAVNLALMALLQGAGLDVEPVLLPHRDSGQRIERYPSLQRFRQLVARVRIGEDHVWLDASIPNTRPGLLRREALGMEGWVLGREQSHWVRALPPNARHDLSIRFAGRLTVNGDLKGEVELTSRGYPALEMRRSREERDGLLELVRSMLLPRFGTLDLEQVTMVESGEEVRLEIPFAIDGFAMDEGDLLQFPPLLAGRLPSHPLGDSQRREPVRLDAPERIRMEVRVELPRAIRVESGEWRQQTGGTDGRLLEQYRRSNRLLEYRFDIEMDRLYYRGESLVELQSIYDRWMELSREIWRLEKTM
ncbi:MAG: hypothetical protein ACQER4_02030 [Bacteroidota bacterium]